MTRKQISVGLTLALICLVPSFSYAKETFTSQLITEPITEWNFEKTPIDTASSDDMNIIFSLTAEHTVDVYNNRGKLLGSIPVDPGVIKIETSPGAEYLYLTDKSKKNYSVLRIEFSQKIDTAGAPVKGPADAPVTIALFTDFQCPYCKRLEPILDEVLQKNPKTTKLVFKNMPLISIHKFADEASRAALAADNQGKFWEFHDELFSRPKLSDKIIQEIAQKVGLDMEKWKADMESQEIKARLAKDVKDAVSAGVKGTPTVFINGRPLNTRTVEGFQAIIDKELQSK